MNPLSTKKPHVVIVGAGFGGIQAAKRLAKTDTKVTIIDMHNYHLFQPLLYQVATAGLSEIDITCPIRSLFRNHRNVDFRMDEVIDFDLVNKLVVTHSGSISYDYLLLATGSTTNYFGIKSLEENAFGLKTLSDSVAIRNHIIKMFEQASHEADQDKRRAMLTFVVVGGGPTGVEASGALSELIHYVLAKEYHTLSIKEARILLVEASDTLLAVMPRDLQEATVETLTKKYVEVRLLVKVNDYDGQNLFLQGDEVIPTHTVIWAAGVSATPLISKLKTGQDRASRAIVNEYLQIPASPEVFVIGDAAHFEQGNSVLPMVAPVAIQEADTAVQNIINLDNNQPLLKFVYKPVGNVATIGRNAAVVYVGRFKSKGFFAWVIWSIIHVIRLIHFRNRTVVIIKWIWEYLTYDRVDHVITQDTDQ